MTESANTRMTCTDKSGRCGPGGTTAHSFDLPVIPIQGAPTGICLEFLGFRRAPHPEISKTHDKIQHKKSHCTPVMGCFFCFCFITEALSLSTQGVSSIRPSFGDLATWLPLSFGFNEALGGSASFKTCLYRHPPSDCNLSLAKLYSELGRSNRTTYACITRDVKSKMTMKVLFQ